MLLSYNAKRGAIQLHNEWSNCQFAGVLPAMGGFRLVLASGVEDTTPLPAGDGRNTDRSHRFKRCSTG